MLQLTSRQLTNAEQKILNDFQSKVNAAPDFVRKVEIAGSIWKTKGNIAGKKAFEKIKMALEEMCVGVKICNYCEGNEAGDIEHVYPKSFFPEYAFIWTNYLLACKQCNSGYKLDLCFVLDADGNVHSTTRGTEPFYKTLAFINPRIENPDDFLWLNTKTWTFEAHDGLTLESKNKAEKTLSILALNERDPLVAGRFAAADQYYNTMDRLRRIVLSPNLQELKNCLSPYQEIVDDSLPLNEIKENMKETVHLHLQKLSHPTVWKAIKTIESRTNPFWKNIFSTIPEAMNW